MRLQFSQAADVCYKKWKRRSNEEYRELKAVILDSLQAGLASATLVIQCSRHSGTMHASRATLSAGKPLLVVDYKSGVDPSRTEGNEYLKSIGAMGLSSEAFAASPEKYLGLVKGRR